MSTTPQHPARPLPAPLSALPSHATEGIAPATLARYEALTLAERVRACHLVASTGAPLDLACAAVEATRAVPPAR